MLFDFISKIFEGLKNLVKYSDFQAKEVNNQKKIFSKRVEFLEFFMEKHRILKIIVMKILIYKICYEESN